jgi:hypothetical protein
MKVDAIL